MRPETGKGIDCCDDCWYQGKCNAPITIGDITYHCLIDEESGEWLE